MTYPVDFLQKRRHVSFVCTTIKLTFVQIRGTFSHILAKPKLSPCSTDVLLYAINTMVATFTSKTQFTLEHPIVFNKITMILGIGGAAGYINGLCK